MSRQGLGQRENAFNSAKDLESAHGDFLAFPPMSVLLFSTTSLRVDRKKDGGVRGQSFGVEQS